jgi:hypothetical protein
MVDILILDEMLLQNWLDTAKQVAEQNIPNNFAPTSGRGDKESVITEYLFWTERLKKEGRHGITPDTFEQFFDDCKIIGYWYDGFMFFLRDLAEYIEGTIVLGFETGDEKAEIAFEDGDIIIRIAEMVYQPDRTAEDFGLPPLSAKQKLARKVNAVSRGV